MYVHICICYLLSVLTHLPPQTLQLIATAILQDNAKMLGDFLTRTGTNVNYAFGRTRRSLLHVAAGVGAVESLHVLAKRGATIDIRDGASMTPALLAARNNHRRFLKVIVEEYHANLNIADSTGSTIIHWLACNGRTELLKYTLSFKVPVDLEDNNGQVCSELCAVYSTQND
jgi:E3 ubiquitin-protein ligase HACE1